MGPKTPHWLWIGRKTDIVKLWPEADSTTGAAASPTAATAAAPATGARLLAGLCIAKIMDIVPDTKG